MRRLTVLALPALLLAACGGKISDGDGGVLQPQPSDLCARAAPCPNDPPLPEESRAQCRETLAGPCGTQYRAVTECAFANVRCVNGATDPTPIFSACSSQLNAYTTCISTNGGGQPPPPG
jgi:hypothetical protein